MADTELPWYSYPENLSRLCEHLVEVEGYDLAAILRVIEKPWKWTKEFFALDALGAAMIKCKFCNREFGTEIACNQHTQAKHADITETPIESRCESALEILGDLPDGAFFEAAREIFGVEPEDFVR